MIYPFKVFSRNYHDIFTMNVIYVEEWAPPKGNDLAQKEKKKGFHRRGVLRSGALTSQDFARNDYLR